MGAAVGTSKYGLEMGDLNIKSVGPIAFGPDGILFVADNSQATIFAIDTQDADRPGPGHSVNVDNINARLMAYLGCWREDVSIRDMAVHPASENVYFSVMRQALADSIPLIFKLEPDGTVTELPLDQVPFSRARITDPPDPNNPNSDPRRRVVAVTDMAYVDGVLLVAGSSNEEFASTLRRVPLPFRPDAESDSPEIFHVSHGRDETASPIRTFVPYHGNTGVLASYACTPVVHFSLKDVPPGAQVKGRTVAELGVGNTPLDIIVYEKGGEEYVLVCLQKHPLMKIACKDIDNQESLTVAQGPAGVPMETLPHQGVIRMAKLNAEYVLMMRQDVQANVHLTSYKTDSL